ncbi:tungstate transport system substrate-binding protein [Inquilinus ginsengisoli]|uniref:Tungstate transport system substrate-binding protein n=1 Tax=Inquilinus ginsengisoli TaxID=363840 RepID=A0ABU1JIJ4_9PROT|nr:substrate-binding domain-containing protein [Inquilinus ginsengisoli]MDR6288418.1 tungstate transport system substrate-binding protein [Inquilinus ginsengisoli]
MIAKRLVLMVGLLLGLVIPAEAADRFITVASTTSTENSGLFPYLLPIFTRETGIEVRVVAQGTGQAIETARRGDADVLFVHHKPSEEKFVAAGDGVARFDVMYNDFVLVGPTADPAGIGHTRDAAAALAKIAAARAPFLSRGDDSGTHLAELALWKAAGIDVKAASGGWYREAGSGMGATLNTGREMQAYVLTDRATWASFKSKGDLVVLVEGDPALFNQYGVILVSPTKHPTVKAADGQAFIDWLLSGKGQAAIAGYRIDGLQLFFPNARPTG